MGSFGLHVLLSRLEYLPHRLEDSNPVLYLGRELSSLHQLLHDHL